MASTLLRSGYSRMLIILSVILGVILISLPFWPQTSIAEVSIGSFLGRFHPLIVHFPIVLIILPLLLEGFTYWKKWENLKNVNLILLPLAVLSSSLAVLMGYLLLRSGSYSGDLVNQHLWGGVLVSLTCLGAGTVYYFTQQSANQIWKRAYLGLLILANVLTIYTGHLGGSLTHGQNYLSDAIPEIQFGAAKTPLELKKTEEMLVYDDIILGIFQSKCMSCHNAHKAKGGLIMETYEDVMAGGKSEKQMFAANDAEKSELFHRVALEESHDDHMPPSGKPDLHDNEVELIRRWIEEGANPTQTLAETSIELQQLAQAQLPQLMRFQRKRIQDRKERDKTFTELQEIVKHLHLRVVIDPDADSMLFALSMQFPPAMVNDESISKLLPYADVFSKISLPSAEITDDGLYTLSQFSNLRELYLQKTCIKGDGIVYLKSLSKLQNLSLAYTEVDDFYSLEFLDFKSLKNLYLYQTEVGVNVIHVLDQKMKSTNVINQEGPYF